MIRVVLFLIVVGALAVGVAWFADRPGDVVVTWQGMRIETSLMVLGAALLAAMVVIALIWSLLRAIVRSPYLLARFMHHRRGVRAYEAISSGLVAVGAGNVAAARKLAAEVDRIAPHEPLALLLRAQAAQLSGDLEAAERTFQTLASRADTKALGLHGLFIEARRRNDLVKARAVAEEAARTSPALGWAGRAVLEFRCAAGDWAGALHHLEQNMAAFAKDNYRRQRAILLTARALAAEETDRDSAKSFALEANKLAPALVPAATLAARLLAEAGQLRKAHRIVDKAWAANPHPELANASMELRSGDSARDRLKRIEALAKKVPGHIEGALAVARAALGAQEFAKARAAIAPYLQAPTKRIALLMAELERAEKNDVGRAREWVARALHAAPDPAWTADGHVSDRWLPASPVTGRLDTLEWRVPLSGTLSAPAIEPEPPAMPPAETAAEPPHDIEPTPAAAVEIAPSSGPAEAAPTKAAVKLEPKPEPIIPLVHAPDDPGPEVGDQSDAPVGQVGVWRKIFG
jgi:HemY protein